eukprot:jgi/Psemu1/194890/e_gw1.163.17.1
MKSGYRHRLQKALKDANISRLLFLRHGRTASAPVDFDRLLTETGRDQSRRSGEIFGRELVPYFRPALVSPAPRTMETAEIFLDASSSSSSSSSLSPSSPNDRSPGSGVEASPRDRWIQPVDALYDGTMQPMGSALFQKLGYAPLREYLEHGDESVRNDASIVLGNYADNVLVSIIEAVEDTVVRTQTNNRGNDSDSDSDDDVPSLVDDDDDDDDDDDNDVEPSLSPSQTLLVVAHAIYLPAAALGVATLLGCGDSDVGKSPASSSASASAIEPILSCNTKEAEGYLIDAEQRTVRYLSRGD